jgi:hypothetical protein
VLEEVSKGCEDIADFRKEVEKKLTFSAPAIYLSLFRPDGATDINVGDSPADSLDGNSSTNSLVVKTTTVAPPSTQAQPTA